PFLLAAAIGMLCGVPAMAQNAGTPTLPQGLQADVKALMVRGVEAYSTGNNSVALQIFHQAAAAGDVEAMMYLGVMYGSGRGITRNYGTALNWFLKAADAGNG